MASGASARRYAQAIFQIARERNDLDTWFDDLRKLAEAFGDLSVGEILTSPKIRLDQKLDLAHQSLIGINSLARNVASILITKGRVGIAGGIFEEYQTLLNEHRGIKIAEVTTAVQLDQEAVNKIESQMSEVVGKQVMLSHNVKTNIIGGIIIKIGDQLIDGSTDTKLAGLRKAIAERVS